MNKEKARKHLNMAIENRAFWLERYVENEKDKGELVDIYLNHLDGTIREERRKEALKEIKDANEMISKYQRIVL